MNVGGLHMELEKISSDKVKWSLIGRKVNEFKKGDIVSVQDMFGEVTIGEVADAGTPLGIRKFICTEYDMYPHKVTLVTPVEYRFDYK